MSERRLFVAKIKQEPIFPCDFVFKTRKMNFKKPFPCFDSNLRERVNFSYKASEYPTHNIFRAVKI